MNMLEADEIIRGYAGAIGRGCIENGIARYESWLPCSREKIVVAYKIVMAYVAKYKTLTKEQFDQYFILLNMIDSFVPDNEARLIDDFHRRLGENPNLNDEEKKEFKPYFDYINKMFMSDKHDEVVNFFNEIVKLNFQDELYCQKVYTLAGIEYNPEYKEYFQDSLSIEEYISNKKNKKSFFSKWFK